MSKRKFWMDLVMCGPFPPPMHGASAITAKASAALTAQGISSEAIDVAPVGSGLRYHLSRLSRFVGAWLSVASLSRGGAVYISLSGGSGLIYDVVTCAFAALRRARVILHHHSYAYINRRSSLMAQIVKLCGTSQVHIFLAPSMAEAFCAQYGQVTGVAISNLAFFPPQLSEVDTDRPLKTIGYLSNISFEKGIGRFLELMECLAAEGSKLKARIAGPISDPAVRSRLDEVSKRLGNIEYIGPVYGEAKSEFLASIDYFVFPSLYVNEAQPMVVFEAQLAGLPVALTDRGSLKDMAGPDDCVLDAEALDLQGMVGQLMHLEVDPVAFAEVRRRCADRRGDLIDRSRRDLGSFVDLFSKA